MHRRYSYQQIVLPLINLGTRQQFFKIMLWEHQIHRVKTVSITKPMARTLGPDVRHPGLFVGSMSQDFSNLLRTAPPPPPPPPPRLFETRVTYTDAPVLFTGTTPIIIALVIDHLDK